MKKRDEVAAKNPEKKTSKKNACGGFLPSTTCGGAIPTALTMADLYPGNKEPVVPTPMDIDTPAPTTATTATSESSQLPNDDQLESQLAKLNIGLKDYDASRLREKRAMESQKAESKQETKIPSKTASDSSKVPEKPKESPKTPTKSASQSPVKSPARSPVKAPNPMIETFLNYFSSDPESLKRFQSWMQKTKPIVNVDEEYSTEAEDDLEPIDPGTESDLVTSPQKDEAAQEKEILDNIWKQLETDPESLLNLK